MKRSVRLFTAKIALSLTFLVTMSINSYSQSLKPIGKQDSLYLYNIEQLRAVAVLVVESQHNDSIMATQQCIIKDQDSLIGNLNNTVSNHKIIIDNQATLIDHSKTLRDKEYKVFKLEKESLKTKNKKQKRKFIVIAALLVGIIIVK